MTENRKTLLAAMWNGMFRTCPCGRCVCVAVPPETTKREVFASWAEIAARWANRDASSANRCREAVAKLVAISASPEPYARQADEYDRSARRLVRSSTTYRRMANGLPPLAKSE